MNKSALFTFLFFGFLLSSSLLLLAREHFLSPEMYSAIAWSICGGAVAVATGAIWKLIRRNELLLFLTVQLGSVIGALRGVEAFRLTASVAILIVATICGSFLFLFVLPICRNAQTLHFESMVPASRLPRASNLRNAAMVAVFGPTMALAAFLLYARFDEVHEMDYWFILLDHLILGSILGVCLALPFLLRLFVGVLIDLLSKHGGAQDENS